MADCFKQIRDAISDKITDDELRALVDKMENLKDQPGYAQNAKKFRQRSAEELIFSTKIKIEKLKKRKALVPQIDAAIKREKNPVRFFKDLVSGSEKVRKDGSSSFRFWRSSTMGRLANLFERGLKGSSEDLYKGVMDSDIAQAMTALSRGEKLDSFSDEVKNALTTIRQVNREIIKLSKEAGIFIRERENYLTRHTHNAKKIGKVSFDEWSKEVTQHLNKAEPLYGQVGLTGAELDKALKNTYQDIITGQFEGFQPGGTGGKRAFNFTDEIAWQKYNEKFGHGSIIDTTMASLNSFSKSYGRHKILGPDAKQQWEFIERRIKKSLEGKDINKFESNDLLVGQKRQRDALFSEMQGYERVPGVNIFTQGLQWSQLINAASKLGGAVLKTPTDLAFTVGNFRAATGETGLFYMKAMSNFLGTIKSRNEIELWGNQLDIYTGSLRGELYDRYGAFSEGGTGKTEKVLRGFITATGLERQQISAELANAQMFSIHLGDLAKREVEWSAMTVNQRSGLEAVGLNEVDWIKMKGSRAEIKKGVFAITPESMREAGISGNAPQKYANYLRKMAELGVPQPTEIEKAFVSQNFAPDSLGGSFLRTLAQFKSFSLSLPRTFRTIAKSNPNTAPTDLLGKYRVEGDLAVYASVMVEATALSAMGMIARDATKGKKREINSAFWMDAIVEGAMPLSASYFVDAARGEYDKFGASFIKDMAGPTFGQVDDVIALLSGTIGLAGEDGQKAFKKLKRASFNLTKRNFPGQNLFYAQIALNKMFMTNLHEYFNPGFQRRLEKRSRKEGTEFIFNPF